MNKIIEVKKKHIRYLTLSIIIGFSILFILNHFGKFHYIPVYNQSNFDSDGRLNTYVEVPNTNKVALIAYLSYFDSVVQKNGYEFTISDLMDSESNYNKYSYKSYYYIQSTLKDFKYGVCFSIAFFIIALLFTNYKIKLS
jgi:hypothetical protein